ncbi:MAG: hypothetical protein IPL55_00255 [Saprospiraceae bacterium]|nr:hypothetical protein [Saprospiraceae bacterium]
MNNFRYPGLTPFEYNQSDIYFGRKNDIKNIVENIQYNNLLILYGKSGYGKSSLLNAGLIPILQNKFNYKCISIRLGPHIKGELVSLNQYIKSKIISKKINNNIFDELMPDDNSIWKSVKSIQYNNSLECILILINLKNCLPIISNK